MPQHGPALEQWIVLPAPDGDASEIVARLEQLQDRLDVPYGLREGLSLMLVRLQLARQFGV